MAKSSAELRKDYIQDKYVIIAPRRLDRPHGSDVNFDLASVHQSVKKEHCVFCPRNLKRSEILQVAGGRKKWQMVVVKNKYPAVSLDNKNAYGVQEVVVETPDHKKQLEQLSVAQVEKILEVYAARTKALMRNKKLEYILIFKNNGGRAGASLQHAHSQIFATGFIPPHLLDKSQRVQAYKLKTGRCVYCDVIKEESKGPRRVYEDQYILAFTPYASLYNYEIWIMPKRHLDNVTNLNPAERLSFARVLHRVVGKIVHQLNLSYNYYFHQVVHDEDQHLYIKITPRGSAWAGVEIGSGIVVNPVAPEAAAKFYRGGKK